MTPIDDFRNQELGHHFITADEVVRQLLGREVGNLLRFDPLARRGDDPEGIHQLRVNARRLRSELHVVARVIKRKALGELDGELRWMGRILGHQRDLDVLDELFRMSGGIDPSLFASSMFLRLGEQISDERYRVGHLLRSRRYQRLIGRLSSAVINPPLRSARSLAAIDILLPGFQSALTKLTGSVDDLGPEPSSLDLHRIRIMAKQCRYSADIASSFLGDDAKDLARSLADVQTVLGTIHDRVVAIDFLNDGLSKYAGDEGGEQLVELTNAAIDWFRTSIDELRTQWREPFDDVRSKSRAILNLT